MVVAPPFPHRFQVPVTLFPTVQPFCSASLVSWATDWTVPVVYRQCGTRGRQRAILAYEISWFLFDFPVIPLKMTSYVVKWVGLEGWADFRAWFQGNLLWFLMISTWFQLISPRGVRDFFRCRPLDVEILHRAQIGQDVYYNTEYARTSSYILGLSPGTLEIIRADCLDSETCETLPWSGCGNQAMTTSCMVLPPGDGWWKWWAVQLGENSPELARRIVAQHPKGIHTC